jgi:hypothetical protein
MRHMGAPTSEVGTSNDRLRTKWWSGKELYGCGSRQIELITSQFRVITEQISSAVNYIALHVTNRAACGWSPCLSICRLIFTEFQTNDLRINIDEVFQKHLTWLQITPTHYKVIILTKEQYKILRTLALTSDVITVNRLKKMWTWIQR